MDMQKLKYFIAIVEHGTISKAAMALNMTQPPLSMSIKSFEEEIGVQLFKRMGKRLHLTDSGKLLYDRGKELLASSMAIIQEVHEHDQGMRGHVTIGCSTVANLTIIPEVVKRLNERSIQITIQVKEGNAAYILEQLRYHKMDIGIVRNIFDKADLHTTALLTERLLVALPPDHPLAGEASINLEDLRNENFLLQHTTFGHGISDFILDACQTQGFTPNVIYWGTETLPMLSMVKRGLGIAFSPMSFAKLTDFNLPPLLELTRPVVHTQLNLVTLKNSVKKAATEQFLEITKEVIEELNVALN
ncbi:LysR family transcriptional regulator [Sporosarcina sp. NPDC096371]|uniref:LysR family transcriptional regulator n=1 Tax=Sporosarcina sp. NPDC096371 TaxID=3364530 RepID=UPI00382F6D8E